MTALREAPQWTSLRALEYLAAGRPVVVVGDDGRSDLVLAAQFATADSVAALVACSTGFVVAAMPADRADALDLPAQYRRSTRPGTPRYCVTVDAVGGGVTTGISAHDRARTLRLLAGADTGVDDLTRPGHVIPARVDPSVLSRLQGAEARLTAAVVLAAQAGLVPVVAAAALPTDDDRRLGTAGGDPGSGVPHVRVVDVVAEIRGTTP